MALVRKILVYYRGVEIPAANPKEANIIWFSMQVDSEVENALGLTDQQYTDPKEPEPVRMNACFFPDNLHCSEVRHMLL